MSNSNDLENIIRQMANDLAVIKNHLATLVQYNAPISPNYRYPLSQYADFDWASIGATAVAHDRNGATQLNWGGYTWKRRNDNSKKRGQAIWFSRPLPESESSDYARLITFADLADVEPMSFTTPSPTQSIMTTDELDQQLLEKFDTLTSLATARKVRTAVTFGDVTNPRFTTAVFSAVDAYLNSRAQNNNENDVVNSHNMAKNSALAVFRAELAKVNGNLGGKK